MPLPPFPSIPLITGSYPHNVQKSHLYTSLIHFPPLVHPLTATVIFSPSLHVGHNSPVVAVPLHPALDLVVEMSELHTDQQAGHAQEHIHPQLMGGGGG